MKTENGIMTLDEAIKALKALPNFRVSKASVLNVRNLEKIIEDAAKTIEELEERIAIMTEGGWIPVEKRLPDESCDCIIVSGGEAQLSHFTITEKIFWTPDIYEAEEQENVEYWMPLPEPPTKGGD